MTFGVNELCRSEGPEAFAGLDLQHDLQISLRDWRDWDAIAAHLSRAGAELNGLSLSRQEAGFSARARVRNISSQAARTLSQDLIGDGLAERATVEHLMLARRDVG